MQHIDGIKPSHPTFGHRPSSMQPTFKMLYHILAKYNLQSPCFANTIMEPNVKHFHPFRCLFMCCRLHYKQMDHFQSGVNALMLASFYAIRHTLLLQFLLSFPPKLEWLVPNFIASMMMHLTLSQLKKGYTCLATKGTSY